MATDSWELAWKSFVNHNQGSNLRLSLGQVTKVSPRLANTEILCVGSKPVDGFSGVIRYVCTATRCACRTRWELSTSRRAWISKNIQLIQEHRRASYWNWQGNILKSSAICSKLTYTDSWLFTVRPSSVVSCTSQVEILTCYRPGDIVRAEVLSVGDVRSFFLTTARNELGVIFAKSLAGRASPGLAWNQGVQMNCLQHAA